MTHDIEKVISCGMCVGCGACSVRTGGAVPVTIGRYGVYQADVSSLSPSHRAEASSVCPFSDDSRNEDELAATRFGTLDGDELVGRSRDVWAGRLNDEERLMGSSSGGLTSWLLEELIVRGHVDGIVHVGRSAAGHFEYTTSTSVDELRARRKSSYTSTTMADALLKLRGDGRKYAIVGVPCFIRAARLLAEELPDLGEQLRYFVGLVCGHLKSQFFAESLAWQAGIAPADLQAIDFRVKNPAKTSTDYDYAATSRNRRTVTKATSSSIDGNWGFAAFQPEACNFCDDIFAETADIVFADAWLPQYTSDWRGTNIALSRDETLSRLMEEGAARGDIHLDRIDAQEAAKSQMGNYRHRRQGLQVRLADDLAAGQSVPRKRVTPSYSTTDRSRQALIRQRRRTSRVSLQAFRAAVDSGDLNLYLKPMRREIARYRWIEAKRVGIRGVVRFVARAVIRRRK